MKRSENGSAAIQVAEDIVPIGEFKSNLAKQIRGLRGRSRPLIVTQNGKAAAVMLAPEEFDRLTEQARFLASVQRGLDDDEEGRVVSDEDLARILAADAPRQKPRSKRR